jgi:uncharacterized protein
LKLVQFSGVTPIVCSEKDIEKEENMAIESGWKMLKIEGPLDFALTGILAKISTLLSKKDISIFAISTYDTDYILVKESKIEQAVNCLAKNDYMVNC